jgi:iron complex transport system substrate-binding protein
LSRQPLWTSGALLLAAALVAFLLLAGGVAPLDAAPGLGDRPAARIVSLMPNLTEMAAAVGAGPQLVGISDYCQEPPELCRRLDGARLGGNFDPNLERILELAPDLVMLPEGVRGLDLSLAAAGVPSLRFDTQSLASIEASYLTIGRATGHLEEARGQVTALRQGLAALGVAGRERGTRPRVLIVVNHLPEALSDLWVAGRGNFLDEILTSAGAVNVIEEPGYPPIGREGLLRLDPDVILDFFAPGTSVPPSPGQVMALWRELPALRAVAAGRVYYRHSSAYVVPGPRLVTCGVLEDVADMLAGTAPAALER